MPLWYVGSSPSEKTSLASFDYVNSLVSKSLSDTDVKQSITNFFSGSPYASFDWANNIINATGNQAFARRSDLLGGVTNKIPILGVDAQGNPVKSRSNGPVALDSIGRVYRDKISIGSAQGYPRLYWSASTYTNANNISTETTISTITVNPYPTNTTKPYRVFVTGVVNARTTADGQAPQIQVRANNALTGQIVANGYGLAENYKGCQRDAILTAGSGLWNIPAWCQKIDIVMIGGGGGGINLGGVGGGAGEWFGSTITRGVDIDSNVTSLSYTVGAGAEPKNFNIFGGYGRGGVTSCVIPGSSGGTLSANGGKTGENQKITGTSDGQGAPDYPFAGITYPGSPDQTTKGATGNAPGGGGAGGALKESGGSGAPGAIWFCAYLNDFYNYGQAQIVPTNTSSQAALTGSTTLYVNALRASGSTASITTSSFNPQVSVMVIPA